MESTLKIDFHTILATVPKICFFVSQHLLVWFVKGVVNVGAIIDSQWTFKDL